MTPVEYYQEQCNQGKITADSQQLQALSCFQNIHHKLIIEEKKRSGILKYFYSSKLTIGAYLWGNVGSGKTFLMDCLYDSLPFNRKMRVHFHKFMRDVHRELKKNQGELDPLKKIAGEIAKKTIVICFDEFIVSDIADAMILGRLLNALFANGVCLVATSNTAPDDLYKKGLQRLQFLPAIEIIKKNVEVIHIASHIDYRLRHLQEAGVFYTPLNQMSADLMQKTFNLLTHGEEVDESPIYMNDRLIPIKKQAGRVIWFDFSCLCHVPRSQQDYLNIAEKYDTVFISDIPVISENSSDRIRLFINLIDVLYDAHIKLVISAAVPVQQIYSSGSLKEEYRRTASRLLEMQSMYYFNNKKFNL